MTTFLYLPLGFRCDGSPFWASFGGDGEDDKGGGGSDSNSADADDSDDDGDDEDEKDPVKRLEKTLKVVREERKAARDEFRPFKAALRELGIDSPDALKAALTKGAGAKGGNSDVDLEKVREDARKEARQEANRDLALAKVEALATGVFADPDDAVTRLSKRVDDLLDRDGKPDPKAIKAELAELLEEKPHWGVKKQGEIGFDGGARQSGGGKKDMNSFLRDAAARKRGQ